MYTNGVHERLAALTGLDDADLDAALAAVLRALAPALAPRDRPSLFSYLPDARGASAAVEDAAAEQVDEASFYEVATRRDGVRAALAREQAQMVCEALGVELSPEIREQLSTRLARSVFALFSPCARGIGVARPPRRRSRTTLAEGRAGSQSPVSEAAPPGAQADSVAAARNPHGNTKVSSTTGLTQERERETLASGSAGPRRPISDG
jgi:hypothetical protein